MSPLSIIMLSLVEKDKYISWPWCEKKIEDALFHWSKWITGLYYTSQDINWWMRGDYCDVFLSAVWTFNFDGTHSLQTTQWWASDVMVNFSKSVWWRKTHLCLGWPQAGPDYDVVIRRELYFGWAPLWSSALGTCPVGLCVNLALASGWVHFQQIFILGRTIPLMDIVLWKIM